MKLNKVLIGTLATFFCIGSVIYAFNSTGNIWSVGTAAVGIELTSGAALVPGTDNTVDLGSSSLEYKDLYIDGTANIDTLAVDAATVTELTSTIVAIADISVTTPTAVGQLRFDTSTTDLYISTSVVDTGSWQKVGSQS